MTQSELDTMKAAFLAKSDRDGALVGIAYGVNAEADRAKRAESRMAAREEYDETAYERRAESVREAYHTGGRHAAIDAMNAPSHWRY